MRNDERLDEEIDAALRSYAVPGETSAPRVAFARVLERSRHANSRRLRWFGWAAATAACAVIFVTVLVIWSTQASRSMRIASLQKTAATSPAQESGSEESRISKSGFDQPIPHRLGSNRREVSPHLPARPIVTGSVPHQPVQLQERELPKLAVFPAAQPLSGEERRLEALAVHAPLGVKRALLQSETHPRPLATVAAFRIRPLDPGEDQESSKEKEELP